MTSPRVLAQSIVETPSTASEDALSLLSPIPHSQRNPLLRPGREYRGIPGGDFIFYPGLIAGAIYDSNLLWSNRNKVSAAGVRVAPGLDAERDAGIHKTSIYGDFDAKFYPTLSNASTVNATAGLFHRWEIQRDLVFKTRLEYGRKSSYVSGGVVEAPPGTFTPIAAPLTSDQFRANAALQKNFDRMFVGVSGEVAKTSFDKLDTAAGKISQSYRDSVVSTGTLRAGYWFAPVLYGFAETAFNMREYTAAPYASRGYRATAGVGSDRISLFRGEVFAGVQRQAYSNPAIPDSASPVFGGKLYWYPTRAITVRATLDQTITDSSVTAPGNPAGMPANVTSAQLNVDYQMARDWRASWRAGYDYSNYIGSPRRDNGWWTGATFTYDVFRSLSATFDYEYFRMVSNTAAVEYSRHALRAGVKYRY